MMEYESRKGLLVMSRKETEKTQTKKIEKLLKKKEISKDDFDSLKNLLQIRRI